MQPEEILSEFQSTMRHIAASVYAITTKVEGQRYGIVATAFRPSASIRPRFLSASIRMPRRTGL